MCGIVGAVAERPITGILIEGLKRLEYRGYDSAGVAVLDNSGGTTCMKREGKVETLAAAIKEQSPVGTTGIAHTRWATHGVPSERNAHPHQSGNRFSVVHNGIIENHQELRESLTADGYVFASDTDTEVIVHLIHKLSAEHLSLRSTVFAVSQQLVGAYGMVVVDSQSPDELVVARSGSPLVIGYGLGEHFVASDQLALLPVTQRFAVLEEGDVATVTKDEVSIIDASGQEVEREIETSDISTDAAGKAGYKHYMLKEIFEQPEAIRRTLKDRIKDGAISSDAFGSGSEDIFSKIKHVQIVACGTSYNAGMVARYWIEQHVGISCSVEIASEFRYRKSFVHQDSLLVTLSQSGETADTLAALRLAKSQGYLASLTICNVETSSLVRESDFVYLMNAGPEIGVASTKAFTVQLSALLMLSGAICQAQQIKPKFFQDAIDALLALPAQMERAFSIEQPIKDLSEQFADKQHALFLGRGDQYPVAMEGALKLKEISYIHAEAYAAGELKHGPLALIDADMPVVVVAPTNDLLDKLKSNIEEVRARGSVMYVFADSDDHFESEDGLEVVNMAHANPLIAPILFVIPLQFLSYYVALVKGTDVDQPRNLAKSVTVE
ncbi:glutamine--fructose-6-phosphate transaminase (isomerizing) [Porticoccaceae bacterium]|nr:glutamine--fructose-6-phosphate transaminase (isomerizing) [Porticoccaceae bacterium]MDA8898576.1 glutamine--fructose-6-phosphate transaminase (isomerizing) [Porticoccaceae bacterium]